MNSSLTIKSNIARTLALIILAVALLITMGPLQQSSASPAADPDLGGLYAFPDHSGQMVVQVNDETLGLPSLRADYDVDIRGDLATVTVVQSFKNPTNRVLEPIYEFPLYEQAAVFAMTMEIGETRVDAEVKRRDEAREIYDEARERGQQAALLDQDRPNLFVQRVANVEPGQTVEITLRYTHALPRDQGQYHLAIPLAIPERFRPSDMSGNLLVDGDGPTDPGATAGGASSPGRDAARPDDVSISVNIDGGMPVTHLNSSSHDLNISSISDSVVRASLAPDDDPTTRHFRMSYQLADDDLQIGAHSFWSEADDRGYFDLLIEPPGEVIADTVPNREVVFLVDNSGSMRTDRMRAASDLVYRTLAQLRPDDHFRIIVFNSSFEEYSDEPLRATDTNIRRAQDYISGVRSGGGTMMVPPLKSALQAPIAPDTLRMLVFVTDVKVSNEFEVMRTVKTEIGDARIFAIGIGGGVNRYLLEALGRVGRGFSTQFGMNDDVERITDDAVRRLQSPVLTDIEVDWNTLNASQVTPTSIADVFEGGAIRLQGQFDNPGRHTIEVHGTRGGDRVTFEREVDFSRDNQDGKAVQLAWARQQIRDDMHQLTTPDELRGDEVTDESLKERIIELGLAYSLTTQWTSLVAVADDITLESQQHQGSSTSDHTSSTHRGGTGLSGGYGRVSGLGDIDTERHRGSATRRSSKEAQMDLEVASVSGGLEESHVAHIIDARSNALHHCYQRSVHQTDAQISGALQLQLLIDTEGEIQKITISDSSLDHRPVTDCIERVLRRLRFDKPDDDRPVRVVLDFEFSIE